MNFNETKNINKSYLRYTEKFDKNQNNEIRDDFESKYKAKYIKYKFKYIFLQNKLTNNLVGGSGSKSNIKTKDLDTILSEFIKYNLESEKFNLKTILLDCIEEGNVQTEINKIINFIIQNNVAKISDKHLNIALLYAVNLGYHIVADELIKLGAKPNFIWENISLIDMAIRYNFFKTAQVLMNTGAISSNYYSPNQLNKEQTNLSLDSENIIFKNSSYNNQIRKNLYDRLKEILLSKSPYDFQNLSRNNLKKNNQDNLTIY